MPPDRAVFRHEIQQNCRREVFRVNFRVIGIRVSKRLQNPGESAIESLELSSGSGLLLKHTRQEMGKALLHDRTRGGRDELNLTEFPMALLSDRPSKKNPSSLRFETGEKVWEIAGHPEHGLPTAGDVAVYVCLMELTREQEYPVRVRFTRHDLLQRLGWSRGAGEYRPRAVGPRPAGGRDDHHHQRLLRRPGSQVAAPACLPRVRGIQDRRCPPGGRAGRAGFVVPLERGDRAQPAGRLHQDAERAPLPLAEELDQPDALPVSGRQGARWQDGLPPGAARSGLPAPGPLAGLLSLADQAQAGPRPRRADHRRLPRPRRIRAHARRRRDGGLSLSETARRRHPESGGRGGRPPRLHRHCR